MCVFYFKGTYVFSALFILQYIAHTNIIKEYIYSYTALAGVRFLI